MKQMCEKCDIFPAFVCQAGPDEEILCYPCYFWGILGKHRQADEWLDSRIRAGESELVKKWQRWNE